MERNKIEYKPILTIVPLHKTSRFKNMLLSAFWVAMQKLFFHCGLELKRSLETLDMENIYTKRSPKQPGRLPLKRREWEPYFIQLGTVWGFLLNNEHVLLLQ